jgi:predicted nucleic-acid-binding protein
MKGIDSNVLLRLIVRDDAAQLRRAERFLLRHCSPVSRGFVNRAALCESVWVLDRSYGYARAEIAMAVERILLTSELEVEDADAAAEALLRFKEGHDFADVYIAASNRLRGCDATATFDRRASRLPLFQLI